MAKQVGRPGITLDDVVVAVGQLRNEQRPITSGAVREVLGTGSYTTIQKYLSEVLDQEHSRQESAPTIPSGLSDQGSHLVRKIWETASQMAQAEIAAVRKEAFDKANYLEKQVEDLCARLDTAEQQLETKKKQLAASDRKAVLLKTQSAKHEAKAALLTQQLEEWVTNNARD